MWGERVGTEMLDDACVLCGPALASSTGALYMHCTLHTHMLTPALSHPPLATSSSLQMTMNTTPASTHIGVTRTRCMYSHSHSRSHRNINSNRNIVRNSNRDRTHKHPPPRLISPTDASNIEATIWPRLAAIAEALWSGMSLYLMLDFYYCHCFSSYSFCYTYA